MLVLMFLCFVQYYAVFCTRNCLIELHCKFSTCNISTTKLAPQKVKSVSTLFTCIQFACSGCTANKSTFGTSTYVLVSRRYVASLSVALAFLLTGYTHSGYHKTLGRSLGIPVLRPRSIFTVLKNGYSHIQGMLQCMCDGAKKAMKALPVAHNLETVTTADACWLTRGHFSHIVPILYIL